MYRNASFSYMVVIACICKPISSNLMYHNLEFFSFTLPINFISKYDGDQSHLILLKKKILKAFYRKKKNSYLKVSVHRPSFIFSRSTLFFLLLSKSYLFDHATVCLCRSSIGKNLRLASLGFLLFRQTGGFFLLGTF